MGKQKTEGVGQGFKWAWASRGVSLAVNVVLLGYLTYYCTDILGMSAALVGGLLLGSKIFDGVTDIAVGFIIDRTKSRWGQARPYQMFILPCWLLTILIFSVPDIGNVAKAVYIFILYTLINSVCATFLNGSDAICLARTVRTEKDRVSVTCFTGAITMVACIVLNIAMPQLIQNIGTTSRGWTLIAAIFGVPLGIIGMFRFLFCKEFETAETKKAEREKVSLKESVSALFHNKYILILTGILLLFYMYNNISTAVTTYYYKYIVGNIGLGSIVGMASFISPIVIAFTPAITRKLGTVKYLRYGLFIGVVGLIIRTIGGTNLVTLVIGSLCSIVSTIPITSLINIYIVDCMTYGAWKTGKRIDGLISSITAFGKKIGGSIASGLVGLVMGMAGYNGALDVQSATANTSIIVLYNILPAAIMILMFLMSLWYNLDKLMPKIKAELAEREAEK